MELNIGQVQGGGGFAGAGDIDLSQIDADELAARERQGHGQKIAAIAAADFKDARAVGSA